MAQRMRPLVRTLLAIAGVAALIGAPADARRGGSFGSRGSRTHSAPSATRLSPGYVPPVSRSMTERPAYGAPAYAPAPSYRPAFTPPGRGLFGGFGGGLLTGLVAGGLVGHFLGHGAGYGWGGSAGGGVLAILFQLALIGGGIWLVMRLFRGRSSAPADYAPPSTYAASGFGQTAGYAAPQPGTDIRLTAADQDSFERLLLQLQEAFSREDYSRLREITTPEVMSYLAEELSDNATHGRRNEVSATRLLDGEVSEAWSEDGRDYATIVLRYESIDVMRDRTTGLAVAGDPHRPTETTELWTFVRQTGAWGSPWKVSAIQEG